MPPAKAIDVRSLENKVVKVETDQRVDNITAEWVVRSHSVHIVSSYEKFVKLTPPRVVDLRRVNRALRGKRDPVPASTITDSDLETA